MQALCSMPTIINIAYNRPVLKNETPEPQHQQQKANMVKKLNEWRQCQLNLLHNIFEI